MFGSMIRYFSTEPKQNMKPIELKTSPEQMQTITKSMILGNESRKLYDQVRYDLKEIAFPSSLPDPPHIKKCCKLTWHELFLVLKEVSRLYAASWVRDIGADLRPNDYKKDDGTEDSCLRHLMEILRFHWHIFGEPLLHQAKVQLLRKILSYCLSPSNLTIAARGGIETLRPALQRLYMTRASAYRDALKSFIEGYQEDSSKAQQDGNTDRNST
ncbi:hypothetical protein ES288_A13G273500v1 [Gossypium darwinii]|uniref:Uncharacterized protein n=1 Tax=Gossypium darwinii TaxID=34276 RepID=A0A5D2E418_GOSDA|nr:hypothetical protein ES288_A13G273500v1 [Gossypium darwinii]